MSDEKLLNPRVHTFALGFKVPRAMLEQSEREYEMWRVKYEAWKRRPTIRARRWLARNLERWGVEVIAAISPKFKG